MPPRPPKQDTICMPNCLRDGVRPTLSRPQIRNTTFARRVFCMRVAPNAVVASKAGNSICVRPVVYAVGASTSSEPIVILKFLHSFHQVECLSESKYFVVLVPHYRLASSYIVIVHHRRNYLVCSISMECLQLMSVVASTPCL